MPKKIENVRELLLEETKRQMLEKGYKDLNIRSVANACKLGTGTVYNYFKSKEMLVASVLLADWKEHLREMSELACDDSQELLGGIYESLRRFARDNQNFFQILPQSRWLCPRRKGIRSCADNSLRLFDLYAKSGD